MSESSWRSRANPVARHRKSKLQATIVENAASRGEVSEISARSCLQQNWNMTDFIADYDGVPSVNSWNRFRQTKELRQRTTTLATRNRGSTGLESPHADVILSGCAETDANNVTTNAPTSACSEDGQRNERENMDSENMETSWTNWMEIT